MEKVTTTPKTEQQELLTILEPTQEIGQNCINALSVSGGKIVFAGIIELDGPLTIQKGANKTVSWRFLELDHLS